MSFQQMAEDILRANKQDLRFITDSFLKKRDNLYNFLYKN